VPVGGAAPYHRVEASSAILLRKHQNLANSSYVCQVISLLFSLQYVLHTPPISLFLF